MVLLLLVLAIKSRQRLDIFRPGQGRAALYLFLWRQIPPLVDAAGTDADRAAFAIRAIKRRSAIRTEELPVEGAAVAMFGIAARLARNKGEAFLSRRREM